jgi:hypothetical protein
MVHWIASNRNMDIRMNLSEEYRSEPERRVREQATHCSAAYMHWEASTSAVHFGEGKCLNERMAFTDVTKVEYS